MHYCLKHRLKYKQSYYQTAHFIQRCNWTVPRRLFCFGSLVMLDVVCRYLSLFLLYLNIKIGPSQFWLFSDFRCGVSLFIIILLISKYKNRTVPRGLFCFGSLVNLDVMCRYLSLFVLYLNIKNRPSHFWLFYFGSLVILDVVCRYLSLVLLYLNKK